MKILVVDPAYYLYDEVNTFGIGTLIIYENLLSKGNIVSLLTNKKNENFGKLEIISHILENNYEIICFSSRGDTYPFIISLSEMLKEKKPNLKIILGGPQATLTAKETMLKYKSIDIIVKGPGEGIIQKIICSKFNPQKLNAINNIVFRKDDDVVETEYVKNICKVKFPLASFKKYHSGKKIEDIYIEAGRGCTFNCTYCVTNKVWDKTYLIREPKEILSEIIEIKNSIKFKKISFIHDNILSNKNLGEKFLFEMMQTFPKELKWTASIRIDLLNKEVINLLKKAGCSDLYIGLETGSQKMQKIYKKYIDLNKAIDNFLYLEKSGIKFTVSLIIGHPDESLDDLFETIYIAIFLKGLSCCSCIQFHKLAFVYGSELYKEYEKSMFFIENEVSDQANIILSEYEAKMVRENKKIFSTYYSYRGPMMIDNIAVKRENLEVIINTYYKCLNIIRETEDLEFFKKSILQFIDNRTKFISWINSYKNKINEYFDDCLELENLVYELMTKHNFSFDKSGINSTLQFVKNDSFNLMVWKASGNVILCESFTKEKEQIFNVLRQGKEIKAERKKKILNNWKENFLIK